MPRAAVRVQGAQKRTYWTLDREGPEEENLPPYTPRAEQEEDSNSVRMQGNGQYFDPRHEPPLPRYESYDGSGYGSPEPSQRSSLQYNKQSAPAVHQTNGLYDDFDFDANFPQPPQGGQQQHRGVNGNGHNHFDDVKFGHDQVQTHNISLNTKIHTQNQDIVGRHLLYETALLDTQSYEILSIDEVDELKKEHVRLNSRIEAANRKLVLESKVKDAAQSLQKLYKRPDTPQSPDSPRKDRNSLLGNRRRAETTSSQDAQHQAEDELTLAIKKVDDLNSQIKELMDRRLVVERKLLRHTAAVLAEQASQHSETPNTAITNNIIDDDDAIAFGPDDFDGIRDILKGRPQPTIKQEELEKMQEDHERQVANLKGQLQFYQDTREEHEQQLASMREQLQAQQEQSVTALRQRSEQQLASMQKRLESLNSQLRTVITEATRTRGQEPEPEPPIQQSDNVQGNLDNTFILLENNMQIMEQEHEKTRGHYKNVQDSAYITRNTVEEQLEGLNNKLYKTLEASAGMQAVNQLHQPPEISGHGYQQQLQYLEQALDMAEQLLQEHKGELHDAKEASRSAGEAQETASKHIQKSVEYETVLAGLWDIVNSSDAKSNGLEPRASLDVRGSSARSSASQYSPVSPIREDFSLQAFSSRVQHLFDVANGAKEQQDILRRQIQQQRDLNGKSDMEKDREIEELQARYEALNMSYDATQQDLAKTMASHEQSQAEALESRNEMQKVMEELDQLHKTIDETKARSKEVDERHTQLITEKNQLSVERDAAHEELEGVQKELENLESEVVRLTTELTMAKAELEGAYGSRSERKKEAGVQEKEMEALATLKDQEIAQLRREHAEKTRLLEQELQDMMNEFQEMTRESLELEKERGQLEGLIDSLRERVEQLETQLSDEKAKWMGIKSPGEDGGKKESTSVMVLRQEFKKMMRENRAEGVRLLKVEQEERRRLETEIRKIRQATSPLGRQPGHLSTNSLAQSHARLGSVASSSGGAPTINGHLQG
ncbi:hypothetical protein HII31_02439 [Pseudocercospora fuligena]|uniref:Up-regulated during septation protein 1 domain-containing protein n=1 Tax=Pseudocercospora fuligena TaxID=685502 RepID=A0A8H6RT45_9PEZI|nr:hypothetical protein HII31_02439 [Pseudocercospora fuligena]